MARVEIIECLFEEIEKKFKRNATIIYDLIESVADNPNKGKLLGTVGGIAIREIRYRNFRFNFITDGYKLHFMNEEELTDLLLVFVRMSDKKHQQQTIDEIKKILFTIGPRGLA